MLKARRSLVRVPMRSLNFFFSLFNPYSRTVVLGFTRPLNEMSTRSALWGQSVAGSQGWKPNPHLWHDCKMWDPRYLSTLYASTASFRASLMFFLVYRQNIHSSDHNLDYWQTRVLVREGRTATETLLSWPILDSDHDPEMGLYTKTDLLSTIWLPSVVTWLWL